MTASGGHAAQFLQGRCREIHAKVRKRAIGSLFAGGLFRVFARQRRFTKNKEAGMTAYLISLAVAGLIAIALLEGFSS
jgi:hypothetical protein